MQVTLGLGGDDLAFVSMVAVAMRRSPPELLCGSGVYELAWARRETRGSGSPS